MKEVQDLLKGLMATLNEAVEELEDMPDFEGKDRVLSSVDTAYNEISYTLTDVSQSF